MTTFNKHREFLGMMALALALAAIVHNPQITALGAIIAFLGYVAFTWVDCLHGFIQGFRAGRNESKVELAATQQEFLKHRRSFTKF